MIISVEELRKYIQTDETDEMIEERLQAIELLIREYTNNRFHQNPFVRIKADVVGGVFASESIPFKKGDTVHVTMGDNATDCGLYTVKEISGDTFTVNEPVEDMWSVKVTKVQYRTDVRIGVINIMKWIYRNEAASEGDKSKKDIQSETISRHSVTYVTDATETDIDEKFGVPKKKIAFLKHYVKGRF